jgi:hypothetical protein
MIIQHNPPQIPDSANSRQRSPRVRVQLCGLKRKAFRFTASRRVLGAMRSLCLGPWFQQVRGLVASGQLTQGTSIMGARRNQGSRSASNKWKDRSIRSSSLPASSIWRRPISPSSLPGKWERRNGSGGQCVASRENHSRQGHLAGYLDKRFAGDVVGIMVRTAPVRRPCWTFCSASRRRPSGSSRLFGSDSFTLPAAVKKRIGFVPQQDELARVAHRSTAARAQRVIAESLEPPAHRQVGAGLDHSDRESGESPVHGRASEVVDGAGVRSRARAAGARRAVHESISSEDRRTGRGR